MVIFRNIGGVLKRFTVDFCTNESSKTMVHAGWITLNRLGVFNGIQVFFSFELTIYAMVDFLNL
jgi:hypothetical protein